MEMQLCIWVSTEKLLNNIQFSHPKNPVIACFIGRIVGVYEIHVGRVSYFPINVSTRFLKWFHLPCIVASVNSEFVEFEWEKKASSHLKPSGVRKFGEFCKKGGAWPD